MKGASVAEAKEDRRINRTRLLLRTAMTSLIREKGFEALTVQDIIDRADVGRSTFYAHFKSKEDLLKGAVDMMRTTLRQFQRRALEKSSRPGDRMFGFSRELFEHAAEHLDVFAAMVGKHSGTVFQQHLHRMLAELIREDVEARAARKKPDASQVEAAVQFVAGGLLGLLVTWLNEMTRVPAAELDDRFRRMAIPAVEAMLG
jgi:AcrR family transcriptional regulator